MNVYDFDNTIYDGESMLDFFKFYLRRHPSLLKHLPGVLYAFGKYKAGKITVNDFMTKYSPEVEKFFSSIPDFHADAVRFWDTHMHKIKPFYAEIQKEDDLIITGSPEASMKVICERLGIKNYMGSQFDEKTGKITRFCIRSQKIKAFFESYPEGKIDDFYTDSPENDKPLIDIATRAFVVKGDKITQIK